jgi:peptidoglycan/LPS O-acetylase OafA/YrhL
MSTTPPAEANKIGPSSRGGKLINIQLLRALAASLVVVDHALIFLRNLSSGTMQLAWQLGNVGVWTFFVISGFIMYYSEGQNFGSAKSSLRFAWKRFARIVPLYWTATIVAVALSFAATMRGHSTPLHSALSLRNIVFSFLFIPYAVSGSEPPHPILGPGWTLEYEMIFYLLFGLSMILSKFLGTRILLSTLICIVALGAVVHPVYERTDDYSVATFLSDPILLLFVVGVGFAAVVGKFQPAFGPHYLCLIFLLVLIPCAAFYYVGARYPLSSLEKLAFSLPCAFAVMACISIKPPGGLVGQICALLGDASYATYLSNLFVVSALSKFVLHPGYNLSLWCYLLACVCLANMLGVALHFVLERPLLKVLGRPAWIFGSRPKSDQPDAYPAVIV